MTKRKQQNKPAKTQEALDIEIQAGLATAYRLGLEDGHTEGWNNCALQAFGPLERLAISWAEVAAIMASIRLIVTTTDKINKLVLSRPVLEELIKDMAPQLASLKLESERLMYAAGKSEPYLDLSGAWELYRAVELFVTVDGKDDRALRDAARKLIDVTDKGDKFESMSVALDIIRPTRQRKKNAPYDLIHERVTYWRDKRNLPLKAACQRVSEELWDQHHYTSKVIKTYYERACATLREANSPPTDN